MSDDDLWRHVAAELSWDPQVDSDAIEVSAADGTVTLRGTVASLRVKRAGGRAAARVRGVTRVANELRVQIPDKDQQDDEDLRGDVLEALMLDVSVRSGTTSARQPSSAPPTCPALPALTTPSP
jgi:hypothetical protein